jgi:VanZ family protein
MIRHLKAPSPKMAVKIARIAAWIFAFAIVVLSIVPPGLRPQTNMPSHLEHFAIFFATGVAFLCGYGQRTLEVAIALVAFAGLIEIAQIYVPGRHARLSDFLVDSAALCVGIVLASLVGARRLQELV